MNAQLSTLPNGFRIATDHMPGLKSAAIAIYVLAGSRHEREDQNGIAHFLEHMAFKGTRTRTAIEISQSIEDVGGFLNAYTSQDKTAYFVRVLEEDIPFAVELLADILLHSTYSSEEMDKERNVILNEIRQYMDYPEDVVFEGLQRTIYPNQPLGRPILGSLERVANYRRDDILGFVGQYYHPSNLILASAGAVEHDQMVNMAEKHFGHLVSAECPDYSPGQYHGGEFRKAKDIEQVQFVVAFESPPIDHEFDAATKVFARLLAGGSSSRLFAEIREKRGLCYGISSQVMAQKDTGLFVIHAITGQDEVVELTHCCMDEIARSLKDITESEVKRAVAQIKSGILMSFENPMPRVERMCYLLSNFGHFIPIEETIDKYQSVTVQDATDAAIDMIESQTPSIGLYGPIENAPTLDVLASRLKP